MQKSYLWHHNSAHLQPNESMNAHYILTFPYHTELQHSSQKLQGDHLHTRNTYYTDWDWQAMRYQLTATESFDIVLVVKHSAIQLGLYKAKIGGTLLPSISSLLRQFEAVVQIHVACIRQC